MSKQDYEYRKQREQQKKATKQARKQRQGHKHRWQTGERE